MKKMLSFALMALGSFATLAQMPVASTERPDKSAIALRHEDERKNERRDKAAAPLNHGQTVRAVAQSSTLTTGARGAAVSAVASTGRSTRVEHRSARGPRTERSHSCRPAGSGHANKHQDHKGGHAGH
jgi:hypothetical protein